MLKTEGIVLNEMKFRETSKIVTIYTKSLGKISVMANGAYNPKSKLIALTQTFGHNEYHLRRGKSFYYINEGDVVNSFYNIREDFNKVLYGYYILELLEKSVPVEQENQQIFQLLKKALLVLSDLEEGFLQFIIGYEVKYISFLGYRPYIDGCVYCGKKKTSMAKFSIERGGILCEDCFGQDRYSRKISKKAYDVICQALYLPLEALKDIEADKETLIMAHDILVKYILDKIDRDKINSLEILETIDFL